MNELPPVAYVWARRCGLGLERKHRTPAHPHGRRAPLPSWRPWSSRWRLAPKTRKAARRAFPLSLSPSALFLDSLAPVDSCSLRSLRFVLFPFCFPPWRPKNYDELHQATALSARWLPSCALATHGPHGATQPSTQATTHLPTQILTTHIQPLKDYTRGTTEKKSVLLEEKFLTKFGLFFEYLFSLIFSQWIYIYLIILIVLIVSQYFLYLLSTALNLFICFTSNYT